MKEHESCIINEEAGKTRLSIRFILQRNRPQSTLHLPYIKTCYEMQAELYNFMMFVLTNTFDRFPTQQ